MDDETRDTSSDPLDDEHLRVGGEVDPHEGEPAPDINQDMHAGEERDMTDISAEHTDDSGPIPDPDGPADPEATQT